MVARMKASATAAPTSQLSFLYNPPGIMPGKGAREVTAWFTHDPAGGVKFTGAVSRLESLAKDLVPYAGKEYLYEDSAASPKFAAPIAALTDAFKAAMSDLTAGKPYVFDPTESRHALGYSNGGWELIAFNRNPSGKSSDTIFNGRFGRVDQTPAIQRLEASLAEFGQLMRKRA